jgi:hypothetical protein
MGLWLKCPGCQTKNPLYGKVCFQCGQSLEHIAFEKRVYVVEESSPVAHKAPPAPPPATIAVAAAAAEAAAAPAEPLRQAAPKAEKKPKRPKKKKG